MSDSEPLLFRTVLGTLRPLTGGSEDALKAIGNGQTVRIEIKRTTGNVRRLAWYWVMLKIALENLADAFDGPVTTKSLHRWLKREAGLATPIVSRKTGEVIDYDYDSISFASMTEDQRAAFVDFAAEKLSARLGVDVDTLRREAEAA
jgi:hypothetical protein